MALSCDTVSIFEPLDTKNPCFKIQLRNLGNRYTVNLCVQDENDRFEVSTAVTFFVSMTLEQLLEIFPTAEVIKTS